MRDKMFLNLKKEMYENYANYKYGVSSYIEAMTNLEIISKKFYDMVKNMYYFNLISEDTKNLMLEENNIIFIEFKTKISII